MPDPNTTRSEPGLGVGANGADELHRGRLALSRLADVERELALVRHHQDAKIAELEERLGWFEENELDFRDQAERWPWLRAGLCAWSRSVKLARRFARLL
ncbi:MAG TPA: hypothetical protein VFQ12_00950, partial [Thermoleophilaceae bacterium]|nr:hypothetical protein [Thermoleophilaceae bacterium]